MRKVWYEVWMYGDTEAPSPTPITNPNFPNNPSVKCLLNDNLGGVVLVKRNNAKCTAWLAFTMVPRCAVAASMGWIRWDTLNACTNLLEAVARRRCGDCEWLPVVAC